MAYKSPLDKLADHSGVMPTVVGIVGHEASKFTPRGQRRARKLIRELISGADVVVSGHCPLGGIDIWAEEEADKLGIELDLKIPQQNSWDGEYGFKARNLDIARTAPVVHVILADRYPTNYRGRRFTYCYHCHTSDHIKSGGCWTAHRAKKGVWHIVEN